MEEQEIQVGPMWYDYEVKDKMAQFVKENAYLADQDRGQKLKKNWNVIVGTSDFNCGNYGSMV